jgi:hypothetical protein
LEAATSIIKGKLSLEEAIKDEIKSFIADIANDAIIYNDDNYFCKVKDLPGEIDDTIRQKYLENFRKIYNLFGLNDGITAWNYFRNLLIDGFIAFEVIYDKYIKRR